MVTGGSEAAVTIAGMGLMPCMRYLRNDDPKNSFRPMGRQRDCIREGAGALILKNTNAVARGHIVKLVVAVCRRCLSHNSSTS
jgi:3-oxoacyl-[acyl-carrier-protein] synthase II